MKRIICSLLTMVLLLGYMPTVNSYAAEVETMDELDVIIAASTFMNSNNETSLWTEATYVMNIIPLYDETSSIIAYYLQLSDCYAVVNNNINNPTLIEFGKGSNPLIKDILTTNSAAHIIYNNPYNIYQIDENVPMLLSEEREGFFDYYPELKEENEELAAYHAERRTQIENRLASTPAVCGDGDYGFIDAGDMSEAEYDEISLLDKDDDGIDEVCVNWVSTDDLSYGDRHCGATAVTNLALYFASQGYTDLMLESEYDTFVAVYDVVGHGPKATIADEAKEYFSDRGHTLKSSSIGTLSGVKTAIKRDRPCAFLLADGIVEWHWILAVGYREYESGETYMRIVDGWSNNADVYYKTASGSVWWSATQYWVTK